MAQQTTQTGKNLGARNWLTHHIYLPGMAGPVLSVLCAGLTAWEYRGHGAPYSMLRQAISDLGNPEQSALAMVFNVGFVVGGAGMVVFVLGARRLLAYVVVATSVLAALGMSLIGVFPDHVANPNVHDGVALAAFLGILGLSSSFTIYCRGASKAGQFKL